METIINFVLQYWFFAAIVVSAWAFFKFATFNRRNIAKVKGDNNTVLQLHTLTDVERRKEVIKLLNTLEAQNKWNRPK